VCRTNEHPSAELYKMVCERNETDLDIGIPAVLLPKDAGTKLQSLLSNGEGIFLMSSIIQCCMSCPCDSMCVHTFCNFLYICANLRIVYLF
jgi:hypothetical protein